MNNKVVGAGFVMDYTIDTGVDEIQGIDNVLPDELAPNRIAVNMTLRVYRTPDNDPVADGIAPGGDNANAQLDLTTSPYISVELRDKVTDKTIIFLPRAWIIRRSGSVEAEQLLTETWAIKSIGYVGPGSQASQSGAVFAF